MSINKKIIISCLSFSIFSCYVFSSTHHELNAKSYSSHSNKITYIYVGSEVPKHYSKYFESHNKNYTNKNKNKNKNNDSNKDADKDKSNNKDKNKNKNKDTKLNHNKIKQNYKDTSQSNQTDAQKMNRHNQNILLNDFLYLGVVYFKHYKFTYASQSVAPGKALNIPGRHVKDGFVVDKDNYIVLGAHPNLRYNVYDTPFGKKGKVYDSGPNEYNHLNVYVK